MLVEEIVRHRQAIKASIIKPEDQRKGFRFENIIGQDRKMFKIYEMISALAMDQISLHYLQFKIISDFFLEIVVQIRAGWDLIRVQMGCYLSCLVMIMMKGFPSLK